jgi:hypothetical protein
MNSSTEKLEQIIMEMRAVLPTGDSVVPDTEYRLWLDFLKKVHPQSKLLENTEIIIEENFNFNTDLKHYSDVREIMILAETKQYPTWFIQPNFKEPIIILAYDKGELKNIYSQQANNLEKRGTTGIKDIPNTVKEFTGKIRGIVSGKENNQSFIACDIENEMNFLQKMEFLESTGFKTADYILFPTDKITTISSDKLETSLQNYISTITPQHGVKVDGVIIISDGAIFTEEDKITRRIIFQIQQ